jgi:hypothetical protein
METLGVGDERQRRMDDRSFDSAQDRRRPTPKEGGQNTIRERGNTRAKSDE